MRIYFAWRWIRQTGYLRTLPFPACSEDRLLMQNRRSLEVGLPRPTAVCRSLLDVGGLWLYLVDLITIMNAFRRRYNIVMIKR